VASFANTRELLEYAAAVHGDIEAYVEPGARITFAEWVGRARGVATQFAELGVGKGDVVTLWLPSGIDYATCYAAAAMIGAITTGLNPRLGRREIESILQQADPMLVVADKRLGVLPDTGHRLLSRDALCSDMVHSAPATVELTRRDLVALIFTSGTTGTPKGAAFDADRLAAGAAASGVMSVPSDRRLTSTPFSHAG
jgi:acyl-CoA synthetase (AMP-forming)/AMP-acid ligase II